MEGEIKKRKKEELDKTEVLERERHILKLKKGDKEKGRNDSKRR